MLLRLLDNSDHCSGDTAVRYLCFFRHVETCLTISSFSGFIAALFTIAREWNQPRCSLIDEEIRKMWYINTMEYWSAEEKNEIVRLEGK